ncbi:bacillithiol biosynthesis cysteine-adding enzyme BshC [Metabacillus crassostreae]|uniref:bacillithiol biosynthesis cysteine-adding enzyme BshC n=1 Tax=Metabacillus crassostreae TaxID=929098 RepID=UPI00195C5D1F|nr:bacillithiol biosynthesis cysteine-adding enzyme BshC [Metabacillus crassostreae]MBM7603434.1 bacillithiol biosynthesis cysteine-adding enzyme BshC [Metabacillus crassostreae]
MEIVELSLRSSNQFMNDLMDNKIEDGTYFDYDIHSEELFNRRALDLKNRSFQRDTLSSYLFEYTNRCFPGYHKTLNNIERLKDPDSVVVIGGQQAGLLTGPLYTIHKIISIIVLAREQEAKLGLPVIPVFWIAGEDHDFAEINHLFVNKNGVPKKHTIKDSPLKKQSVSQLPLNQKKTVEWIEEIFEAYGETDFTNQLIQQLKVDISESDTYVHFFEKVIMNLFRDEGLVLINSGDPELRNLEKACFRLILEQNQSIYAAVVDQQQKMISHNYSPIIDLGENSVNLFYHHDGERFLIERAINGEFIIPDINIHFSYAELMDLIETTPEKFSNNVVTRPLMQEFLFPTLAFIAGPGEVTYWAELKKVFSVMEMKMPPVMPRLQITLLERSIERNLIETSVLLEDLLHNGIEAAMKSYLDSVTPVDMKKIVDEAKKEISSIHSSLINAAVEIDPSLDPMLQKNGAFIQDHLDFLLKSVEKRQKQKHQVQLSKYKSMELSLVPNLHPQERIWNIYYYINKFGPEFVRDLLNLSYSFNQKHKIVKL